MARKRLHQIGALLGRLTRFGIVGVAATLTHVAMVVLAVEAGGIDPRIANVLAYLVAVPVSYLGHYFWTFGSTHPHGTTILRFGLVSIGGFLLSQAIMTVAVAIPGLGYRVGLMLIVVLVPVISFGLNQCLVFSRRRTSAPAEDRLKGHPS